MYKSFINVFKDVVYKYSNVKALEIAKFSIVDKLDKDNNNFIDKLEFITYKQLNIYSDILAISLLNKINENNNHQQQQQGSSIVIGVSAKHSYQLIISLLSVFKAGFVYLPLDISLPKDRLQYMIDDSECSIIIVQHHQHLNNYFNVENNNSNNNKSNSIICIDCLFNSFKDQNEIDQIYINQKQLSLINNNSEDLAYLIYTSGSTGKPKGVLVNHRGIVNFLEDQIESFHIKGDHSRLLQSLPVCFDASLSEIGCSLLSGSTMVISASSEQSSIVRGSPTYFYQYLKDNHITTAMLAPSFISELLHCDSNLIPPSLETIVIGGEVCPQHVISAWTKHVRIVSVYGPTEATVCTSLLPFPKCNNNDNSNNNINYSTSIGIPVKNMDCYLIDQESGDRISVDQVGKEGEIYISGIGVARGYHKLEELNRKSFFTSDVDNQPVYKTGDWGRILPNGTIEFRGRIDNQIKLNGQRIELDEIARSIERYPIIQKAVVDVKTIESTTILVAYVILKQLNVISCKQPQQQQSHQLQEQQSNEIKNIVNLFLRKSLPCYMLPSHYIVMNNGFPINSNEKVDRSKLPLPTIINISNELELDNNNNNNNNEISRIVIMLKNILSIILAINDISINDDLIGQYGLNSISSIRFIQLARSHGVIITPIDIYKYRTIENLSKQIVNTTTSSKIELLDGKSNKTDLLKTENSCKETVHNLLDKYLKKNKQKLPIQSTTTTTGGAILLTGATGLLGSHILLDILQREQFKDYLIYILVRDLDSASTAIYGQVEYLENQSLQTIVSQIKSDRVRYIRGDITVSDHMQLNESDWSQLVNDVTVVIHCAAVVHMNLTFENMIHQNVVGMVNIINFLNSCRNTDIQFHYMSTLSVLLSSSLKWDGIANEKPVIVDSFEKVIGGSGSNEIYGSYAQSKWMCEYILELCKNDKEMLSIGGDNIFIHRPAMICCKSESSSNYLNRLIQSSILVGCFPIINPRIHTDITPIHIFTKEFCNTLDSHIRSNNNNIKQESFIYHFKSISLMKLFKLIVDDYEQRPQTSSIQQQQKIEFVSANEWKSKIGNALNIPNSLNFLPLLDYLDIENDYENFERILFPGRFTSNINNNNILNNEIETFKDIIFNHLHI